MAAVRPANPPPTIEILRLILVMPPMVGGVRAVAAHTQPTREGRNQLRATENYA
jgi:hypothetical protein